MYYTPLFWALNFTLMLFTPVKGCSRLRTIGVMLMELFLIFTRLRPDFIRGKICLQTSREIWVSYKAKEIVHIYLIQYESIFLKQFQLYLVKYQKWNIDNTLF